MHAALGIVGILSFGAGFLGMLMLPAVAGIQAGMVMLVGALFMSAVHVADRINVNTALLKELSERAASLD